MDSLNKALEPLELTEDEATELDEILAHPRALPVLPLQPVPRLKRELPREHREYMRRRLRGETTIE